MAKKSKILNAVHQTASDLHKAGALPEVTMHKFDKLCLPPISSLQPHDIKHIREKACLSQAVFAAYLNTSVSTIQKWEIGNKKPGGIAMRLLNLIQKHGIKILV
jgi:putative transcriptional regulator